MSFSISSQSSASSSSGSGREFVGTSLRLSDELGSASGADSAAIEDFGFWPFFATGFESDEGMAVGIPIEASALAGVGSEVIR